MNANVMSSDYCWVGSPRRGGIRKAGTPAGKQYPLKKMLRFAMDAITTFSYKPLKLASYAGVLLSMVSFLYLLYVIYLRLFTDKTIQGWASTLAVSLFFNGVILMMLGIIGEYLGRIFDEAKEGPFILRDLKKTTSR